MKDLKVHCEKLSAELDGIIGEHDELQEDINRATQEPISSSALILEINKWKENMIKKVEEMADQACGRVTELLNEKRMQLTSEFRAFSQDLAHRKESENFVEPDLVRLEQIVRQFNQELKQLLQPPTIELEIKEIDYVEWDFLISIGVKPNTAIYQEQQQREFIITCLTDR
jgi:hypothetical protein